MPVLDGYHDGCHGRKRTAAVDDRRCEEEDGFKRRCGSRSVAAV
uniref:Uncharacterized protein n=1 Tax=Arundo donax TaxID=35708 RepID=A0A0A9APL6_ARUDO